jgi:hypothetical protein
VERAQVLAVAGIAPEELQAERWPIDHITRLWRAAVQCTQDASFGCAPARWWARPASMW